MFKDAVLLIKEAVSKKDFSFLMFTLSLFLLSISINLSTFTFIASLVLKLIQTGLKKQPLFETKALKNAAIIGFVFFSYIVFNSIIQTSYSNTFYYFEKYYVHFVLFFLTPILLKRKKENALLLLSFIIGCFTAITIVFIYSIVNEVHFGKQAFIDVLDIHHTYLSMYLLVFINCFMVLMFTKEKKLNNVMKLTLIVLCIISVAIFYILGSKVSMLILLLLFLLHSLPELSKKNTPVYIGLLSIILIILLSFNNKLSVSYEKALDFRIQVWEMSFNSFESNPMFGDLSLPEKDILNFNHYLNGKYYFLDSDLNSHNQYLSILMRFGVVGLFILFLFVINIFRKTSKKTSKRTVREVLGFLVISLTVCYIENILDRHHGIVFITFFYNYYLVAIENNDE